MKIDIEKCVGCGACKANCPVDAIEEKEGKMVIDDNKCIRCGNCALMCGMDAVGND